MLTSRKSRADHVPFLEEVLQHHLHLRREGLGLLLRVAQLPLRGHDLRLQGVGLLLQLFLRLAQAHKSMKAGQEMLSV